MNNNPIRWAFVMLTTLMLLANCGAPAGSGVAPGPATPQTTATAPQASATAAPAAPAPSATAAPEPSVGITPRPAATPYIDDRSGPTGLIDSFYNAIGNKEFARAYGYWKPGAQGLAPYEEFKQGYGDTNAVQVTYGPITSGVGAGQLYYSVPVGLAADTSAGQRFFVGCYTLHLGSPSAQATPPFQPLAIERADVREASGPASADALAGACETQGSPLSPTPNTAGGIGSAAYVDDRSDAPAVLRSFYNAINRREYLRAYSYWQDTTKVPPLPEFEQGYANTREVALITGDVQGDAGAGQRYYTVPVKLSAQQADGTTQLFAGCYTLHLASPPIQEPPFQPLGIVSASIQQVGDDAAADAVVAKGCQVGQ